MKVVQLAPDGQTVVLRLVMTGEAFGGVAAFSGRAYLVSAVAAEDCLALSWNGRNFDLLLRRHPQFAINFIEFLAERLHHMQAKYEDLATRQVEQRLARAILRRVRRAGRRVDGGVLIDVRLSRQHLAEMTGTSMFTVSRILKRWQESGIIKSARQRIMVSHPHGLVVIADDLPSV